MGYVQIEQDATGALTRRGIASRMVAAGVSLGMAVATAEMLNPDEAAAQAEADPGSVALSPTDSSRNVVQPTDSGTVPLTIKGAAEQVGDLQQWHSPSGGVKTRIRHDGSLVIDNPVDVPIRIYGRERGGGRYLTQFGVGGGNPGLVTNGWVTINGLANEPFGVSSLNIGGRTTYMLGVSSDVGAAPIVVVQGPGPILEAYRGDGFRQVEWAPSGLLALRGGGTATSGPVGDKTGDKLGLYGSTYGLGIQSARLVAYLASSAKLAIRRASDTGQRSSGADIITLGEDGNIELLKPGKGVILTSPDGRVRRRIGINGSGAIVAVPV